MATSKAKRVVRNLSCIGLEADLDERMNKNIDLDEELRHVAANRKRAPWLRKAIETLCKKQESERNGGK